MAEKIILSLNAEKERLAILEYYQRETGSKKIPSQIYVLFSKALDTISHFPFSGKIIGNEGERVFTTNPYQIIYEFKDNQIIVLHIWDSRRNPDELKL